MAQRRVLVVDFGFGKLFLQIHHSVLRVLQENIQATDNRHGQNHIPIFSPHIHIPEAIIGNAPYKAYDGVMYLIVHIDAAPPYCLYTAYAAHAGHPSALRHPLAEATHSP